MLFPNAFKGVKKIRIGQILALIASIAMVVAVVLFVVKSGTELGDLPDKVMAPIAVLFLISGILTMIGFIITLIGLTNARVDERAFSTALWLVVAGIALSFVDTFFLRGKYEAASGFVTAAETVLELAATLFIIKGCMNLAEKLARPDMVVKGRRAMYLILIVNIVAVVCRILNGSLRLGGTLGGIVSAVEICASVMSIVYIVVYVVYLGKVQKMLEA